MSNQSRGVYLERFVMDHLHDLGWTVIRSAGSHGAADVVAIKPGRVLLVQAKYRLSLLGSREWSELFELSVRSGAIAVVAYRPSPKKVAYARLLGPRALRQRAEGMLAEFNPGVTDGD